MLGEMKMRVLDMTAEPTVPFTKDNVCMIAPEQQLSCITYDLWDTIQDLLNDGEHSTHAHFTYAPDIDSQTSNPLFGELWTAAWWKSEQEKVGQFEKIMALIFYVDETNVTFNGRNVHPVYVSLGNLHVEYRCDNIYSTFFLSHYLSFRNKLSGKRLFGFLPTVRVRTAFRGSVFIKRYRRLLNRIAMKFVVQQILDLGPTGQRNFAIGNSGKPTIAHAYAVVILIAFIGIRYNCHIRVPFFIADEMDLAKTILGMFASSSAKRPCNMCDCVFKDNMLINGNPRDYEAIRNVSANVRKCFA